MTRDELLELLARAAAPKLYYGRDPDSHECSLPGSPTLLEKCLPLAYAQLAALEAAGLAIVPAALLVGDGRTHNVCPKCRELTEQPLAAGRVDK